MDSFIDFIDMYSWAMLLSIFVILGASAFLGKHLWVRHKKRDTVLSEELGIILGATLSLFGLLMGFILSIAIDGYNNRISAEEYEAIAIGNAFQRTTLLANASQQTQAQKLLHDYLDLRIQFFDTADEEQRDAIRLESIRTQTHMWKLISRIAKEHPNSVMTSALNAANDLYTAQQKTMASWRHQIPGTAWIILILFGICSNFLIGYNMRGKSDSTVLLLVVPVVTSLALFMISEIDIPGKGMIHVTPHNLEAVRVTIDHGGLMFRPD